MINFTVNHELNNVKQRLRTANNGEEQTPDTYDLHGFSSENDYVPFNSIWINCGVYDKKIIHYSIFDFNIGNIPIKGYSGLYSYLDRGTIARKFQTSSMPKPLCMLKGMLYELDTDNKPVIHFLLSVKKDYIFNMDRSNIDVSQFAIFLSVDFTNGNAFDNVYKRLYKDKIKPAQQLGIPTIIISDISKWCYKNSIAEPKFDTISQRQSYLENFNKRVFV